MAVSFVQGGLAEFEGAPGRNFVFQQRLAVTSTTGWWPLTCEVLGAPAPALSIQKDLSSPVTKKQRKVLVQGYPISTCRPVPCLQQAWSTCMYNFMAWLQKLSVQFDTVCSQCVHRSGLVAPRTWADYMNSAEPQPRGC